MAAPRRRRAAARPARSRNRVVFWPFALFGNPGADEGISELAGGFADRMEDWLSEPSCRQFPIVAGTEVEVFDFLDLDDFARWRKDARARFERCLAEGDFPVFVGGNHLIALPVYEAYAARSERVCIVQLDAHLDAYELSTTKEKLNHGNFLIHVPRRPGLAVVNVGHRDHTLPEASVRRHFDRDWGTDAIVARSIEAVAEELAAYVRGFDRVHIDIDLDVLDPSVLGAVGTPMPFGLSGRELLRLLGVIWSEKVSGVTLSEYNGLLDPDGRGGQLVLWLLEHILLRRLEAGRGASPGGRS